MSDNRRELGPKEIMQEWDYLTHERVEVIDNPYWHGKQVKELLDQEGHGWKVYRSTPPSAPEPPAPEAEAEKTVTLTYKEYIHSLERLRDWALLCEEMAKALKALDRSEFAAWDLVKPALRRFEKMTGKKP